MFKSILFVCFLIVLSALPSLASDLVVAPTRLVFDAGQRVQTLELLNRGSTPNTYRIQFMDKEMLEDGTLADLPKEAQPATSAAQYLKFAPRQITIQPGEKQRVRVFLRRKGDMENIEYRSHLQFLALPDASSGQTLAKVQDPSSGISINLPIALGVSIPVIVRPAELNVVAGLESPRVSSDAKGVMLDAVITRQGSRSLSGTISVDWQAPGQEPVQIGAVSGVSVYTNIMQREIGVPLFLPENFNGQGNFVVRYRENAATQNPAQAELTLPATVKPRP